MKKSGFTLAEVLITIMIIGTVVVLTIPSTIARIDDREFVTALKRAYNIGHRLNQEIVRDYNEFAQMKWITDSSADPKEKISTFHEIASKLFIGKECAMTEEGCWYNDPDNPPKDYSGADLAIDPNKYYKIKLIDGSFWAFCTDGCYYYADSVIQPDGSSKQELVYFDIFVDTNGIRKPNKVGKDIFFFKMTNSGPKPYGRNIDFTTEPSDCTPSGIGKDCTARVMQEDTTLFK